MADAEFTEMYETIKAEQLMKSKRLSDLWSTPAILRRTLVACGVQIFSQFTGINGILLFTFSLIFQITYSPSTVINYFGPQMYESLGVTGSKGLLVQGIYGAVGPIANLL